MEKKSDKNYIKIINLLIIIFVIVGIAIYVSNGIKKKEPENKSYNNTEEMKEKAPLIDMKNTDNAKIENGEKVNVSDNLKKDKELNGLKITNITLKTESGISKFTATVENTLEEDFTKKIVNLKFKKSDGSDLANVETIIPTIKAKQTGKISASTTADIANADDVGLSIGTELFDN